MIRTILNHFRTFFRAPQPARDSAVPTESQPEDLDEREFYTVVLEWWNDSACEPRIERVRAFNPKDALELAMEAAWYDNAGEVEQIPAGAIFDEVEAEEVFYCEAMFYGQANAVTL